MALRACGRGRIGRGAPLENLKAAGAEALPDRPPGSAALWRMGPAYRRPVKSPVEFFDGL